MTNTKKTNRNANMRPYDRRWANRAVKALHSARASKALGLNAEQASDILARLALAYPEIDFERFGH